MPYSKQDCIDALRQASESVDGYLGCNQYRELDISPTARTIRNKFGSWSDAKDEAGLESWAPGDNGVVRNKTNVGYRTNDYGHVQIATRHKGDTYYVYVHRLLALLESDIEDLEDKIVHHKNNIPFDNRLENIEVMSRAEHRKLHHNDERE